MLACALQAGPSQAPGEAPTTSAPGLDARLVSSRPKVRPGEWFPVLFLLEAPEGMLVFLGPPDDGLRPTEGEEETDTRLNWNTADGETFKLVPDLASIQWPRTQEHPGIDRGALAVPTRIYIPVKVVPDTPIGTARIEFALEGHLLEADSVDFKRASPIQFVRSVTVDVVHPTDAEATDVTAVDPELFFGWRGTLPDWTVQDTRTSRPRTPAPALAWIVVTVPVALLVAVLIWLFATRRL